MRFFLLAMPLVLVSCSSSVPTDSLPKASDAPPAAAAPAPAPAPAPSSDEYLTKAAAEPGAVKTASGLVYKELKKGTGPSPKATDAVNVNYKGMLTDGTVFDASEQHPGTPPFHLNQVIACWTEGVQMMKVGGKARLVCPASIAYGAQAVPGIPPNSTLVFEVELLGIGG
jgi:FKBP-type peptidyl-prolyl cis-trans isomerase FkpA